MAYSIEAAARALPDFGLDDQIEPGEDPSYLARQLVTYIWNKRSHHWQRPSICLG